MLLGVNWMNDPVEKVWLILIIWHRFHCTKNENTKNTVFRFWRDFLYLIYFLSFFLYLNQFSIQLLEGFIMKHIFKYLNIFLSTLFLFRFYEYKPLIASVQDKVDLKTHCSLNWLSRIKKGLMKLFTSRIVILNS